MNLRIVTALPGDGNLNGEVEAADYTIWANNFGSMVVAPDGAVQTLAEPVPPTAVPEPSAIWLLAIAIPFLWRGALSSQRPRA